MAWRFRGHSSKLRFKNILSARFLSFLIFSQGRFQGDPFVVHEVIDNGGEPISTSEYYGVGKVTEFRTSSWVGSCIRDNNFGCLEGFGNVCAFKSSTLLS